MNNIFQQNAINAIVFKLQVTDSLWKVLKSQKVAITQLAIGIDSQVTHQVVAMEKVGEQHILIKCYKCNTFQVISDLLHEFMNFNALKIFLKFIKNN